MEWTIPAKIFIAPNPKITYSAYEPKLPDAKLPVPVKVDIMITGILNHAFKHQYFLLALCVQYLLLITISLDNLKY